MNLTERLAELTAPAPDGLSLWDRLSSASGQLGGRNGRPSAKSRPPATLTVVVLVMDVTAAAREGALDLTGRLGADVPGNLALVVDAVPRHPHRDDLTDWWAAALGDWTERARLALGQTPALLRAVYGAHCPVCAARTARVRVNGEALRVPAIGVDWADDGDEQYRVATVHCRACGVTWLRGLDLDELIDRMLLTNIGNEVLSR